MTHLRIEFDFGFQEDIFLIIKKKKSLNDKSICASIAVITVVLYNSTRTKFFLFFLISTFVSSLTFAQSMSEKMKNFYLKLEAQNFKKKIQFLAHEI